MHYSDRHEYDPSPASVARTEGRERARFPNHVKVHLLVWGQLDLAEFDLGPFRLEGNLPGGGGAVGAVVD